METKGTVSHEMRLGIVMVAMSALVWSFGGTIARFITASDVWTIVFWRSASGAGYLIGYMLWRHGRAGTVALFRAMGWPGLGVGLCFATGSASFVIALAHTSVANILFLQAGVPLMAALMAFVLFGERVSLATGLAIAAVIFGVGIMVSESLSGQVSPIGDGLALLIAVTFAIATVITRRFAHVAMLPAVCLGTVIAATLAAVMASTLVVTRADFGLLIAFGAFNLGFGLSMFAMGARLIPAALAALIGTIEPILAPIWVWLVHNEVPSLRTMIGGSVVFLALLAHLVMEFRRSRRSA